VTDTPNPTDCQNDKLPKRNWEAVTKPHWIEIVLGIALAIIGIFQVCIYIRQADIMDRQAIIASDTNALTKSIQRAFIVISDFNLEPVPNAAVPTWQLSPYF
jgi:hypothetical protein